MNTDHEPNRRHAGYVYGTDPREAEIRAYANRVVSEKVWPLGEGHVDLSEVLFVISGRSSRRHGQAGTLSENPTTEHKYDDAPAAVSQYIEIAENTFEHGDDQFYEQTIRHELVHVHQAQHDDKTIGHGESFDEWVDPLALTGRTTDPNEYISLEEAPDYFNYPTYCEYCDELGAGYQRMCRSVRALSRGDYNCSNCEQPIYLMAENGALLRHAADRSADQIKEFLTTTPPPSDERVHAVTIPRLSKADRDLDGKSRYLRSDAARSGSVRDIQFI